MKSQDLFERISGDIERLSKVSRRIANYLVSDPVAFIHAPIRTLSREAGVSEPSIVRFCKLYGCKGVPAFRIELAKSMARNLPEFRLNLIAPEITDREHVFVQKKRAIARHAAGLIVRDRSIIIDSGSTLRMFSTQLGDVRPLSIFTTDLEVVNLLSRYRQHEVIVPPGPVRYDTMSIGGHFIDAFLAEMHFDTLFLGADAIDLRLGLSTFSEEEARKNAAMIRASNRVIVLADSSKFGTPSLHRICDLRRVNVVITDSDTDPALAKDIEELGVEVHRVDPKSVRRPAAKGRRK